MQLTAVRTLTQQLAAPVLTVLSAGTTANLNWIPPTLLGQSILGGYRLRRASSSNGPFTLVQDSLATTFSETLAIGTYYYTVEAYDQFQTGMVSSPHSISIGGAPQWQTVPNAVFVIGQAATFSFAADLSDSSGNALTITDVGTALPSGVTIDAPNKRLIWSGSGSAAVTTGIVLRAENGVSGGVTEQSDWLARSTAAGVVWAHNFDSHFEVDQFRETGGYGLDPAETGIGGTGRSSVQWQSGGFAGGGFLRLSIPTGGTANGFWTRCMSPCAAGQPGGAGGIGNGRTVNDPALNGALARTSWNSSLTSMAYNHRRGYYTHPQIQADVPFWPTAGITNIYDGTEFYLSFRVRISSSRWTVGNPDGKLILIAVTEGLSNLQEVVIRSINKHDAEAGVDYAVTNPWSTYTSRGSFPNSIISANQGGYSGSLESGGPYAGTCIYGNTTTAGNCWEYPADQWTTIQVHLRPGQDNGKVGSGNPQYANYRGVPPATALNLWPYHDTVLEAWKCDQGQTGWTKIFEHTSLAWFYNTDSQSGTNGPTQPPNGAWHAPAFNCIDFSGYMNGVNAISGWTQDFTQIIFSQQMIAAPQI